MRLARKLTLLCAMAVTAMAFTAGDASAVETSVEFTKVDGAQCNPCPVKFEGEFHEIRVTDGVMTSRCHVTPEAELYHRPTNGRIGHVASWTPRAHETTLPGCFALVCAAPENEWPIRNPGETSANVTHMTIRMCIYEGGVTIHCNAEVTVTEPNTHRYELTTNQLCAFGTRRFEGMWNQIVDAAHPAIEIKHDPI